MTEPEIRPLAELALDLIECMPRGYVHASRRGMVAACPGRFTTVCFRRVAGPVVRLELWQNECRKGHSHMKVYPLPADLEARASTMLDNL